MQKILFSIILLLIYACSGSSPKKDSTKAEIPEQKQNPVENKEEPELIVHASKFRILPIDQSSEDPSLKLFVSKLRKIVRQKKLNEFVSCLDTGIVSSYGGGMYGIETFLEEWNLHQNSKESLLWNTMEKFLNLGGTWKNDQKTEFCFPYVQSDLLYPNLDFDWYVTAVCISSKTDVHKEANRYSEKIGLLSYEIVQILDKSEQFTKIKTIDKTISGYVSTNDLIYCASAYPVLEKINGEWKITSFAPYD